MSLIWYFDYVRYSEYCSPDSIGVWPLGVMLVLILQNYIDEVFMTRREYKIHPDYRNSRAVNYNRWSCNKEVSDLVTEIMSNFPANREIGGYNKNMMVLVLDLYESLYYDPEQKLGYYRNHNHYDFKITIADSNKLTENPHITATFFIGAVEHLIKEEYVRDYPGAIKMDDKGNVIYSFTSRILPTQKFADICAKHNLNIDMVEKFTEEQLIRLKGVKSHKDEKLEPLVYDETPTTRRMTKIVRAYNSLLDNTYLDIDVECLSYDDKDTIVKNLQCYDEPNPEIIVKLSRCNVYRVFNNNDWQQGGRFYGAFWIGCPSILRPYITINGNPTIELDYSGIHIQLLYALKGINYAELNKDSETDAYELVPKDHDRDLNKLILLTAINATGTAKTASSVYKELSEDGELEYYGIYSHKPIKRKLDLLIQKHKPIGEYITSGEGIRLQYYDSLVIEQLINYFTKEKITILTIHDSVICETRYANMVKEKMIELYAATVNRQMTSNILKKAKKRTIIKLPHIKYQRSYSKVPSWYLYLERSGRFIRPAKVVGNGYNDNIQVSGRCINYFLRDESYISIDKDARPNICRRNCKTQTRTQEYLPSKSIPYRRTIKLRLKDLESITSLDVN